MENLTTLRRQLLELHRALVDSQRQDYERTHGRTSSGEFLQVLINDPAYAWLQPLTSLVANFDEVLGDADFRRQYQDALQRHPEVLLAHGRMVGALQGRSA